MKQLCQPAEYEEYTKTLKDIDKEGKTKIGFMDNFFMDEKGRYPKMYWKNRRQRFKSRRRKDEVLEELKSS